MKADRIEHGRGRWVETVVARNPGPLTIDGTRTYLLGGEPCLLIDPGPALADHLDAIEVALGALSVAAICVTHYHPDHAAGAADLILRLAAPLAATSQSAELAGLDPPDIALAPGVSVSFGGGRLDVVTAPGHCPDHVCLHWRETGALFTGDVILGEGTSMIAPPEGDMAAYMETLQRLSQLETSVIYPGHGAPIDEPGAKIAEYVDHRRQREEQIIAALAAGAQTAAEIRARVYAELDPRLNAAAEGSVRAHLVKLVREGRVRDESGAYRLIG